MQMEDKQRSSWRLAVVLAGFAAAHGLLGPGAAAEPESPAPEPALRDFHSANGLLNRGLHELAAREYRDFISEHDDHQKAPLARYGLAVCLFRMQRYEEALVELKALRARQAFVYAAEVGVMSGQCESALEHFDRAVQAFEGVLRNHAAHDLADAAAMGRAEALYAKGQPDEAARQCRELRSRWPNSPLIDRAAYFEGLARMDRGNYTAAARLFSDLDGRDNPYAEQASLLLARCYHRNNELDKAVRKFRQVLERSGGTYLADALHGLGSVLLQQGKASDAGTALDRLLDECPTHALASSARLLRGRSWFDSGQFDQALGAFEAIDPQTAEREEAVYWAAKCKLRLGRCPEAASDLEEAIAKYPDSRLMAEMLYDRAVALSRAGDHDAVAKTLGEFRSRYTTHAMAADALHLLASTAHQQGRYDVSRQWCREFMADHAAHDLASPVILLSAENDFLTGQHAAAVEGYRRFLARSPDDKQGSTASYRLGLALYRLGRFDEAEPLLVAARESARREPAFRSALLALGAIHFERGEWKQAEEHLDDYLAGAEAVPSTDDALLKLGLARQRQGRHEEALRSYDRLIEDFAASPHRVQAIFERGQVLTSLGRLKQAAAAFDLVLAEGGESRFAPYARNHLGSLALQRQDYTAAAAFFEGAQDKASDALLQATTLFQKGRTLMAAQQFGAAQESFSRFLRDFSADDRAEEARAHRAIALARQDRHADALAAVEKVNLKAGLDASLKASVQYEKAWCLRESGKTDAAVKAYRQLLDADPPVSSRVHALLELASLHADAKRYKSAADLLGELREIIKDDPRLVPAEVREQGTYRLAVCELEQGRAAEAAALFEEFVAGFPDSPLLASASFYCGEAFLKTGRHERALAHLTRVVESFPSDPTCPASLLRLGECMAVLQRWARGEQVFGEYLDRFGDSDHWYQAQFGVGWARENQGRFDEAIEAYRKVVDRHQGPTAARAQFQVGECLFAKGQYAEAVTELLKVDILYAYPEWSAAALYEAGRCFLKQGKVVEAREQFKHVATKHEQTRWAKLAGERLAEASGGALPGQ